MYFNKVYSSKVYFKKVYSKKVYFNKVYSSGIDAILFNVYCQCMAHHLSNDSKSVTYLKKTHIDYDIFNHHRTTEATRRTKLEKYNTHNKTE